MDYVRSRLREDPLRRKLRAARITQRDFLRRFTARAAGNFLVASAVLDDMAAGRLAVDRPEEAPTTVNDVYRQFLRRFTDTDWDDLYQPLLGKLAVAQEPLTEEQLAGFSGLRPRRVRRALGRVDQYLDAAPAAGGHRTYQLFHASLGQFLLSKKAAGRFWCDAREEHDAIAGTFLAGETREWPACDAYGLRHLPLHLASAARSADLRGLLVDYPWLSAKLTVGSVYDALADFRLAPRSPELDAVAAVLRLSARALDHDRGQLWHQLTARTLTRVGSVDRLPATPAGPWLRLLSHTVRQCDDPLTWVFTGHTGLVKDVCPIPAGPMVASSSADGTVRIWDLTEGREVRRLSGHAETVTSVAASPDGRLLVSGSRDRTVRVWDLGTGRTRHTFDGLPGAVEQVAVSPDGRYLAILVYDRRGTVWVYEWPTRKLVGRVSESDDVDRLAFVPRTSQIATRGGNNVDVWDMESGRRVSRYEHEFESYLFSATALAVSPDGTLLASGNLNRKEPIRIYRLDGGTFASLPGERQGATTKLAFSPDGRLLACAGKPWQFLPDDNVLDDFVRVWDVEARRCVARYPHDGILQAVAFSSDGRYVVSATGNAKVSVWDLSRGTGSVPPAGGTIVGLRVRPAAGRAVTASIAGRVAVWNLVTQTPDRFLRSPIPLTALDVDVSGDTLLTAGYEDSVIENSSVRFSKVDLWRLSASAPPVELFGKIGGLRENYYRAVALCPDGRHAAMARFDADRYAQAGELELWDVTRPARVAKVPDGEHAVNAAVWLSDGRALLMASSALRLWTPFEAAPGPRPIADRGVVMLSLAVCPGDRYAAVGCADGVVAVYDLTGGGEVVHVQAHDGPVQGVCFIGTSERIASAGDDHCVRVWEWRRGECLATFFGDSSMMELDCGNDAVTLVAGEESGRVHFLRFEPNSVPRHSALLP